MKIRRRKRVIALTLAGLLAFALWLRLGSLPAHLLDDAGSESTVVVDRNGVPLYEALSSGGTRSVKLTPHNLPPYLVAATIAAEDRRFWWHPGVDAIAMLRALRVNLAERSVVEGGSTISQQAAKLLLNRREPTRRRGLSAKVREAVIALRLEHRFTKRELLAMYLNLAGYGNQIAGVERASRAYFGAPASMLTPAQCAFLAGLPQRPSGFNPYRSRAAALSRQRVVLRRMEASGALTSAQATEARGEQLAFAEARAPFGAPHFVQMVLAAAGQNRSGRIVTTLDAALQAEVAGVIESHRADLRKHGAANVAVVVLDNATGEWLAWEGSGDYGNAVSGGAINGALTPRQPGSALKPFTYALAFEEGFSPASVLADIPSSFATAEEGILYSPRNYDGRFRGPLLARAALAGSENVPAVALAAELGVPKLLRFLGRAGFSTFDRTSSYYGLGLTLGNAEVRLDELVAAYAAFARGGEWIAPVSVAGRKGDVRRVVSARTAFWITDILSDPEAREYTFGRGGSLEFPFPVAVKTGTSQAYHDNWTVGYSRQVTVGVWVGNFDRAPLRNSSGITGAAPIFHGVMLAAERRISTSAPLAHSSIATPPADITERDICALSGGAANPWCPTRRHEWIAASATLLPCSWHHDAEGGIITILPPEYASWSGAPASTSHVSTSSTSSTSHVSTPSSSSTSSTSHVSTSSTSSTSSTLHVSTSHVSTLSTSHIARRTSTLARRTSHVVIVSPPDGATYSIDPTLRREFQTLSLKTHSATGAVEWTVNGRELGTAAPDGKVEWPLTPGRHRITAKDASGRSDEVTVTVR